MAKNQRYDDFFAGHFYEKSFPDQMPAEVLYLVHSRIRRDSVSQALKQWAFGRAGLTVEWRVATLAEAEHDLLALLPRVPPKPPKVFPARKYAVTTTEVQALKRFYQESLRRLDAALKELRRSVDPEYLALASEVRPVLVRLSASPNHGNRPPQP